MSTRPLLASSHLRSRARGRASTVALGSLLMLACADPLTFERRGNKVLIPESYKSCREGESCTLTGADCSGCCGVEAVRYDDEESVFGAVRRTCDDYDGPRCEGCQALARDAVCVSGRCTFHHTTLCSTSSAPGMALSAGTGGIKDPFSCNQCTCQEDGTLSCGTTDCGFPCSAGMAKGTSCDSCGYNTHCDMLRTACLPTCESTADCGGTPGGVCADGVCKRVCGG